MSPTAIGLWLPSGFMSAVSREEHRMGYPGAVTAAMRPVRVYSTLRTTGQRRATPRRWWVQPEIPGALSGSNDFYAPRRVSSGGIYPFLGPSVIPNHKGRPAGCLTRIVSTTDSVTSATADFSSRMRAAEPKRPVSTCLVAVGPLPGRPLSSRFSGCGQSSLG
ncbi:hypothetical protein EHS25_005779 [Saitozyma podzolica]|jgi:hypothetical protein|uniref:Uncharacterized protein n=1 Tax=Saitozyma podzolica TaxID=1890683 RepID=A0A427XW18_9TREE|nr:hypothetical protein EHS25_005779 [Saitozyma podzolica]